MTKTTKLTLFAFLVALIFSSCQRRYAHLTLTQGAKSAKGKTTRFNGHNVARQNVKSISPKKSDDSKIVPENLALSKPQPLTLEQAPAAHGTPRTIIKSIEEPKTDSTTPRQPKEMYDAKGPETALFFGLLGANVGYFMLPQFTELFAVVLISVLALAVIYLATMMFRNMADTRIRPYRTKKKSIYMGRSFDSEKVKKGFGVFMLVGLAAALISIPLFAVDFWGLAIFLSLLGFVCICAGVILGLTYLILSV